LERDIVLVREFERGRDASWGDAERFWFLQRVRGHLLRGREGGRWREVKEASKRVRVSGASVGSSCAAQIDLLATFFFLGCEGRA